MFVKMYIYGIIDNYLNGDNEYWKSQYNKCIDEMNKYLFLRVKVSCIGANSFHNSKIFIINFERTRMCDVAEEYAKELCEELNTEFNMNIRGYYFNISVIYDDDNTKDNNDIDIISSLFF